MTHSYAPKPSTFSKFTTATATTAGQRRSGGRSADLGGRLPGARQRAWLRRAGRKQTHRPAPGPLPPRRAGLPGQTGDGGLRQPRPAGYCLACFLRTGMERESNPRPTVDETAALPLELSKGGMPGIEPAQQPTCHSPTLLPHSGGIRRNNRGFPSGCTAPAGFGTPTRRPCRESAMHSLLREACQAVTNG